MGRRKKLVFFTMCFGGIVAIFLTAAMVVEKSRSEDLATNVPLLMYTGLTSNSRVNRSNAIQQKKEKGATNVTQNINIRKERAKEMRKPFIKPRENSEPPPSAPTPSGPSTPGHTVPESSVNEMHATEKERQGPSEKYELSRNTTVGKGRAKDLRKFIIKTSLSIPTPSSPEQTVSVSKSNITGQKRQGQGEEKRAKNVSQNIAVGKERVKGLKNIVSKPSPFTPTPSEPNTPGQTVSGPSVNISQSLIDPHHTVSTATPLDLPSNVSNLYKRLVVVTSYSSNHFEEGKNMIASVQKYMPQTQILLYDLGLTAEERSIASTFCNVKVRELQWDKYPEHVRNIATYAWKPLIAREVSQEYDIIMYGDASVRVISPHIGKALACLSEFPFIDGRPYTFPVISVTDNGTIDYFQFPPSRQYMAKWGTLQAGCWLMWANDLMKEKVLEPWVDCALHPECIAPAGTPTGRCRTDELKYKDGRFIGCHRYDQSALNIILAKQFGLQLFKRLGNPRIPNQVWTVEREPSDISSVKTCM